MITIDSKVKHAKLGTGTVDAIKPDFAIVTFESGDTLKCPFDELTEMEDINSAIQKAPETDSDKVIAKAQAALIETINNRWGVFSRSAIDLLPHQLWVCNQVLKQWPVRYLVADDVGLGKTIEAGLIIWGLKEARNIQRILILVPAPLTGQWADRMEAQFDLHFSVFTSESMNAGGNPWKGSPKYVIVSAPTMQLNSTEAQQERQKKLFESEPWDLVIVDEAHHMNAADNDGQTLEYQLFKKLNDAKKVISTVFFTGTPHRGFNFSFWMLMKLIAPQEFDPRLNTKEQYARLSKYFIRNNKANTVDMNGKKLFQPINTRAEEFTYTPEEAEFYKEMSSFISEGKAYSQTLSGQQYNQVQLVLIALQKLASSSISAVKGALITRKNNLLAEQKKAESDETAFDDLLDAMSEEDFEQAANKSKDLKFILMQDEVKNLDALIELGNKVTHESRIDRIIEIVEKDYKNDNVLFFTEYKKTQSLLMTELMKKWGTDCVTFINGDDILKDVAMPDGSTKRFDKRRKDAAKEFNEGKVRFLISTEAAGEGIDLQQNCHILIHADLPWNPMRLHQRVGRINRYGQTKAVDVVTLRNPDTIESLLWNKLETKLDNIQMAFSAGMDDPEDMMQMVLGMKSSKFFRDIFAEGVNQKKENVSSWFDSQTQTFGNQDAIETVRSIVGNSAKFNIKDLKGVPKVDLPDLVPFFKKALSLNHSRLSCSDDTYSFLLPKAWVKDAPYGSAFNYNGLVFRRKLNKGEKPENIAGVGFVWFDKCLDFASGLDECAATIAGSKSYFIYKVYDQKTYSDLRITKDLVIISYDSSTGNAIRLEQDSAIKEINNLSSGKPELKYLAEVPEKVDTMAKEILPSYGYSLPAMELQIALCGNV